MGSLESVFKLPGTQELIKMADKIKCQQVNTLMFDYRFSKGIPSEAKVLAAIVKPLEEMIERPLEKVLDGKSDFVRSWAYENKSLDLLAVIRLYLERTDGKLGSLSITIEWPKLKGQPDDGPFKLNDTNDLEYTCKEIFDASFEDSDESTHLPTIRRSIPDSPYLRTTDDRLLEYGYDGALCSVQSPFQKIQIVDTNDHGRLLILDGMTNLAEGDTEAYTHTLMKLPHEITRTNKSSFWAEEMEPCSTNC